MIKGKNVYLRLIRESDLSELYEKWHDPDIRGPYYPLALIPEPIFRELFFKTGFWDDDSQRMLITDTSNRMLGVLHCFKVKSYSDCVELSYILFDEKKRKRGYMTEAVILFVDYLFNNRRLNRIQIATPVVNEPSIRVAEKAGFIREGNARGAFFLNGKDIDMCMFSLLKKEWRVVST